MRKFTRKLKGLSNRTRNACVLASGTAMALATSVSALAVDEPYVLPASVTSGFSSAGAAVLVIIAAGVTATVGVIAASGGAKAGLKWIKGVFAKA